MDGSPLPFFSRSTIIKICEYKHSVWFKRKGTLTADSDTTNVAFVIPISFFPNPGEIQLKISAAQHTTR